MKKMSKNRLGYIVILFGCLFHLSFFQHTKAYAQQGYFINLKSDIKDLKFNTNSIRFIPIDSIADADCNILNQIINELSDLQLNKFPRTYFLFKVGYYQVDTTDTIKNEKIFLKMKALLKKNKSKNTTLVDINCQDIFSLNSEVWEYEKLIKSTLSSSIFISVYKSRNKITKMKHKTKCYLQ
jgi:hypothetical protein